MSPTSKVLGKCTVPLRKKSSRWLSNARETGGNNSNREDDDDDDDDDVDSSLYLGLGCMYTTPIVVTSQRDFHDDCHAHTTFKKGNFLSSFSFFPSPVYILSGGWT